MKRLALALICVPFAACGLSVGGPPGAGLDGGVDAPPPPEDHGTGQTESGTLCSCLKSVAGWSYVAFDLDRQAVTCPSDFANQRFHVEGITNVPATCGCTCTKDTDGSCALGMLAFKGGGTNQCNTFSNTQNTQSNGCYDINPDYNSSNMGTTFVGGSFTATPSGGTCTATPNPQIPTVMPAHSGQTCLLSGGLGAGCAKDFDCVPDAPMPFQVCVYSATPLPCPPDYPVKHDIGEAAIDDRACTGTCGCTVTTDCSKGNMELFSDNSCNNALSITEPVGGNACTSTGTNNLNIHSVKVTPTPASTCAPNGYTPTGSARLDKPHTVCCAK